MSALTCSLILLLSGTVFSALEPKDVFSRDFKPKFSNQRERSFVPDQVSHHFFSSPTSNAGPNRCKGGSQCCPGWSLNPTTRMCTVPTCRTSCGFGICRNPNLCECLDGGFGSTCAGEEDNCQRRCMNGGRCQRDQCVCKPGYVGKNCEQPICGQPCLNNGRCIGPDQCACPYGYTGSRCEEDYRSGPCFTRIEDNMCRGQLSGVKCTRESCCATIGAAWGVPCSRCPEQRECARGLKKSSVTGNCTDINECRGIPNICSMGTCINTYGSYRCNCGEGRRYDANKFECVDIDECSLNKGLCEFGRCENTDGGFKCVCNIGYRTIMEGRRCVEEDTFGKCYESYEDGLCPSSFANQISKRQCCCSYPRKAFDFCNVCPFIGQRRYRSLGCPDDPGAIGEGGPGKGGVGDGGSLPDDIDVCELNNGLCEFGRCIRVENSFRCECNEGYRTVNNGQRCQAVDVFDTCFSVFSYDQCRSSVGRKSMRACCCAKPTFAFSFCKQCPIKGSSLYRGLVCEDDPGNIGEGGNGKGGVGDGGLLPGETNICKLNPGLCEFGTCERVGMSFTCRCNDGFIAVRGGKRCQAKDVLDTCYNSFIGGECSASTSGQLTKRKCCCGIPEHGFGYCNQCPIIGTADYRMLVCDDDPGYIGQGGDGKGGPGDDGEDENNVCKINKALCRYGKCLRAGNSYRCVCNEGYKLTGDGKRCVEEHGAISGEDGDQQCERNGICDNGRCEIYNGKSKCFCIKGFTKSDKNYCEDEDECAKFPGLCSGGSCQNTPGGFICKCPKGFTQTQDGTACEDVDECSDSSICKNGICKNIAGTYHCQCNKGYEAGPHNTCIDKNECEIPRICPGNSRCLNTDGSYNCECRRGYMLNGNNVCEDIDECKTIDGICKGGHCINTDGAYSCECPSGYVIGQDNNTCTDMDECSTIKNICAGGKCINNLGSYRCRCNYGFKVSATGTFCIETRVGECYTKHNGLQCSTPLKVQITRLKCCCGMENTGIRAWGPQCLGCPLKGTAEYKKLCFNGPGLDGDGNDIDECKNNAGMTTGICMHGRCINMMGDYKCQCNAGFKNRVDSDKNCEDIDECLEFGICKGGRCSNTIGGYTCVCPTGYFFNEESKQCEDEDECAKNPCLGGTCKNTPGSFECICPSGSSYDPSRRVCQDPEDGPCYQHYSTAHTCEKRIASFVSKSECCNSLGASWGVLCEKCEPDSNFGCEKGYRRKGSECQDIDECKFSSACENGRCVNYPGGFRCVCPKGYEMDGNICRDMRIGACYRSMEEDVCGMPLIGSHFKKSNCCCSSFAQAWGGPCEACPLKGLPTYKELCPSGEGYNNDGSDLNECDIEGMCHNGKCVNLLGSFKCECNPGFGMDATGTMCVDINECLISNDICGQGVCVNTIGSFRCQCFHGYRNDMMMEMCMDIDECTESDPKPCDGGTCINTPGSFKCECPDGFRSIADETGCEDINECDQPDICPNGVCQNYNGGYHCRCLDGFSPSTDLLQCFDINECSKDNGGCEYSCTNSNGSFKCGCQPGYRLREDGKTCEDIDECDVNGRNPCGDGNQCTNVLGSYTCNCGVGYRATRDSKACVDIDECTEDENSCNNGECVNTAGSFLCNCRVGYKLEVNAMACIDIDECLLQQNGGCDANARCMNNVGSYVCQCNQGYDGDGTTCVDTDECALGLDNCDQDSECINTLGSFACQCRQGFRADGDICEDINECEDKPDVCSPGTCTNTIGGYKCDCDAGFQPGDGGCVDIDECLNDEFICDHGTCLNQDGSYTCQCDDGFELDDTGKKCLDIDECLLSGICANGICENIMGRYRCICDEGNGFKPNTDQTACIDVRVGYCYSKYVTSQSCGGAQLSPRRMLKPWCCCTPTAGGGWQDDTNESCEECPPVGTPEFELMCPGGPLTHINVTTKIIEEYDGCALFPNYCNNGKCINTLEGVVCKCPKYMAYNVDRLSCEDINECLVDGICGYQSICINVPNGYQCKCLTGQVFDPIENFCIDKRNTTCYMRSVNEEGKCTRSLPQTVTIGQCCCGSYGNRYGERCEECPDPASGQRYALCIGKPPSDPAGNLNGSTTINPRNDIDECTLFPNTCGQGRCVNLIGGYRCECRDGFEQRDTGFTNRCEDIDECARDNPCKNGNCHNIEGAFYCSCEEGMVLDDTNHNCVDFDECGNKGFCDNGRCTNLPNGAGFRCDCNPGYSKVESGNTCKDINECLSADVCMNGVCVNTEGGFSCKCDRGYEEDGKGGCIDVDECLAYPGLCEYGNCINVYGSFMCECDRGFKQDESKQSCKDMNECEMDGFCKNGRCVNTIGGAQCTCNAGYVNKGDEGEPMCEDVNECDDPENTCQFGGTCQNTVGAYRCVCSTGFVNDITGRQCIDIRLGKCYIEMENGVCSRGSSNDMLKSLCCCSVGQGWGDRCEQCPDIGTKEYKYYCPNGPGSNINSTDINECDILDGVCDNGNCVNTDGSYRCLCNEGYVPSSVNPNVCEDKNECENNGNACGNGNCTNLVGSFKCQCEDGFTSTEEEPTCVDIDECASLKGVCAFRCQNLVGSYQCVCPRGFRLADNGKHCVDINECENKHVCLHRCKNIIGGYLCLCPDGYVKDAKGSCIDIDECAVDSTLCQPGGVCQNIEGGYRCDCKPPFMRSPNGKLCEDKSMGLCFAKTVDGVCQGSSNKVDRVSQRDCCCTGGGTNWGTNCRECPDFHSEAGKSLCEGFTNRTINECNFIAHVCTNGNCMDLDNGFRCLCDLGYKLSLNGMRCEDINECLEGGNECEGTCTNLDGDYLCACAEGMVLGEDKRSCVDENECETGNNDCAYDCQNTDGGYVCVCPEGFNKRGKECIDINECEDDDICGMANCVNFDGGYECSCNRGLRYDKEKNTCVYITGPETCPNGYYPYQNAFSGSQCVDVNECKQSMCGRSGCQNTLGSYRCSCPSGSTFQGGQCQDANECAGQPCTYGCTNSRGGFACRCPPGYYPVNGGHCVATQGSVCFSCDTSDVPLEGVPLGENFEEPLVELDSAPLEEQPLSTAQYFPRSHYVPKYAGGDGHVKPLEEGVNYGNFQDFNPYGGSFSYRNRRSAHRAKPIPVVINTKTPANTVLFRMVGLLKQMDGHVDYRMAGGDASLFTLSVGANGGAYLNTTQTLPAGVYRVAISADIKDNSTDAMNLNQIYDDNIKSVHRLFIRVLPASNELTSK